MRNTLFIPKEILFVTETQVNWEKKKQNNLDGEQVEEACNNYNKKF